MTNELSKLNKATQMLAEAKTLDDIRQITSIADAAKAYARAAKLGLEAYNHAAEVKVRAERKAGEMLRRLERGKNNQYSKVPHSQRESSTSAYAAVLEEHDIAPVTAHRWQFMANMPEDEFDKTVEKLRGQKPISTNSVVNTVRSAEQDKARDALARAGRSKDKMSGPYRLICANVDAEVPDIESASVDVIITDPPYPREFLPVYESMARVATRILRPGGLAVVMCGQSYLPEILNLMTRHLIYHWTGAYLTPGGQSAQLFQRKVNTFWKPLLIFSNGRYDGDWFGDVCKSAVNDNDKERHDWGQSESGMADIIKRFSKPGQVVADLFCGSSTTGYCAVSAGRKYIGVDIDETQINISAERLACLR